MNRHSPFSGVNPWDEEVAARRKVEQITAVRGHMRAASASLRGVEKAEPPKQLEAVEAALVELRAAVGLLRALGRRIG